MGPVPDKAPVSLSKPSNPPAPHGNYGTPPQYWPYRTAVWEGDIWHVYNSLEGHAYINILYGEQVYVWEPFPWGGGGDYVWRWHLYNPERPIIESYHYAGP